VITSRRNQRVIDARKLDQRKHRLRQGRFKVEGLQLLHMALDAGLKVNEVFYSEEMFVGTQPGRLLNWFKEQDAVISESTPQVMESLSEREVCQGIVAIFDLSAASLDDLTLTGQELVLILDRPQDPGNVGTLIRTADAVSASAVVLLEPCVDVYDPKTVRGSMGSLFNVPVIQTPAVADVFTLLEGKGLPIVAADAQLGQLWGEDIWERGVALVLGNEARGISEDVQTYVHTWVRLPIEGKAESLNVAVAGGVLMYAWLRAHLKD
jgi:TrmH family RNA methyltransferase